MYRIQKTTAAASLDASTTWHVVDQQGRIVHFDYLKRDCATWIKAQLAVDATEAEIQRAKRTSARVAQLFAATAAADERFTF